MARRVPLDPPVSKLVRFAALSVALVLVAAPAIFDDPGALDTAARLSIFIVLAASCDLMLGYARLVSFAQAMFFGMGACGVALATARFGAGPEALIGGALAGAGAAGLVAAAIGIVAFRGRAVVFAMVTLVIATAAVTLVTQLPQVGGHEGLAVALPPDLTDTARHGTLPHLDWQGAGTATAEQGTDVQPVTGDTVRYYAVLLTSLVAFVIILRLANSAFGRSLRTIRESGGQGGAAPGLWRGRVTVTVLSAVFAALAGALHALWVGHVTPGAMMSFEVMLTILVMVVIGGIGTIWGAVFGAGVVVMAQVHMPDLMARVATATADLPLIPQLLAPERWPLWLGVVLVLGLWVFPRGIAGGFRHAR